MGRGLSLVEGSVVGGEGSVVGGEGSVVGGEGSVVGLSLVETCHMGMSHGDSDMAC